MANPASWIWVLIPLAAIGIAPFKMWLKIKEKQIEAQSSLAAEKTAHGERDAAACHADLQHPQSPTDRPAQNILSAPRAAIRQTADVSSQAKT